MSRCGRQARNHIVLYMYIVWKSCIKMKFSFHIDLQLIQIHVQIWPSVCNSIFLNKWTHFYCIDFQGWHVSERSLSLSARSPEEVVKVIREAAPYLSRLYSVLKQSAVKLNCLRGKVGDSYCSYIDKVSGSISYIDKVIGSIGQSASKASLVGRQLT